MDIDLYKTFLAIGDSGSFTVASQRVGRTQSAVSQQMKRLEETLGRTLFERGSGSIELTDHGKALIEPARSIVETHSKALAAFSRKSFQGNVVVGIPDAYQKRVLTDVVREFMALYPRATINVVIDDSVALSRRIADGTVDLAFVTEDNGPTSGPVVFRDRLVLTGPATGDLHKADPLPLAFWDEYQLSESGLSAVLQGMNRRYRVVYTCRNVKALHHVIASGKCAAVLVESSLIEGERAWLEADGFPVLRELTIRLERSPVKKSKVVDRLRDHFLKYFAEERRF